MSEFEPVPDSGHGPIPKWLILFALFMVVAGILLWIVDFNGTNGILDPGSWRLLQEAANTTKVHG